MAAQKLERLQAWNEAQESRKKLRKQRSEQFKSNLFWFGQWLGSGRSGIFVYSISLLSFMAGGGIAMINLPSAIACPQVESLCYLLRLDKSTVILPEEIQKLLLEYERSKNRDGAKRPP
ncbi:hypothetical protein [Nodularia sp. NIES-3585]|uniref:hypothetical protein n=1 Tax=Nodularia sp. NIES-3585 TaxID=1973477 RepID=UPI000B738588|nr:hypothetical protein [Nodularia sp. NIES-3585]GAX38991.1 hypothetical protein NIES3585_50430 [Nodularia sp. NIES-3585]